VERAILPRVRREDVRGFREAMRGSVALGQALEASGPLLRAVHARYARRGGVREMQYDDQGGLGLALARYQEMVWEAGLIGRELSRNMAKSAFVNSLNSGDALAGLQEFVEVVVRLAKSLTPMTREERVGAPPPPPRKGGYPPDGPAQPPTMLEVAEDGVSVCFSAAGEATLLGKLHIVLHKMTTVAQDPEELQAEATAAVIEQAAVIKQAKQLAAAKLAARATGATSGVCGPTACAQKACGPVITATVVAPTMTTDGIANASSAGVDA